VWKLLKTPGNVDKSWLAGKVNPRGNTGTVNLVRKLHSLWKRVTPFDSSRPKFSGLNVHASDAHAARMRSWVNVSQSAE
jgi:hypothetical protein